MARVAIVTGGTRGIGEAISLALKDMGKVGEAIDCYRKTAMDALIMGRYLVRRP